MQNKKKTFLLQKISGEKDDAEMRRFADYACSG